MAASSLLWWNCVLHLVMILYGIPYCMIFANDFSLFPIFWAHWIERGHFWRSNQVLTDHQQRWLCRCNCGPFNKVHWKWKAYLWVIIRNRGFRLFNIVNIFSSDMIICEAWMAGWSWYQTAHCITIFHTSRWQQFKKVSQAVISK